MTKLYNIIERKIFRNQGKNILEIRKKIQHLKKLEDNFTVKISEENKKRFYIEFDEISQEDGIKEHYEYQSQNPFQNLELSEEEINECRLYFQDSVAEFHNIKQKTLISGEKNYKPEVQEFGILATKVILKLIENNIKPKTDLIIEIVKQEMDISKVPETTIKNYCSFIRRIIKNKKYLNSVLSGEMSISQAYKTIIK